MYRIVFISICPYSQGVVTEKGPIHPSKEVAESWLHYFSWLGHAAQMKIERLSAKGYSKKKGGTSRMFRPIKPARN